MLNTSWIEVKEKRMKNKDSIEELDRSGGGKNFF